MGHQRLGRLPRTLRWRQVVELLDETTRDPALIAAAAMRAADGRFRQLAGDSSVTYSFWLLTRIAWAARGPTFITQLRALGIDVSRDSTAMTLIAGVADQIRRENEANPTSGQYAEVAALAARRALTETVGEQGGPTLFGSSAEDMQRAFREYSTPTRFGVLAHRFFADFTARSLRSFIDRELSNSKSPGERPTGEEFLGALDRHARQASRIVEDFAGGWFSKHNWESKGEISQEDAQRFVTHALRKLRAELKRGADDA